MTVTQPERQPEFSAENKLRLAYFVTHPIQYQVPLLRRIAQEPDIDLKVFFSTDLSVRGHIDKEFGVRVKWDIPLLDGYQFEFLPLILEIKDGRSPGFLRPLNSHIAKKIRDGKFDAVWVHGYNYSTNLQAIWASKSLGIPVVLRTDSTLHDRPRSPLKLAIKNMFFKALRPGISAVLSVGDENTRYWRQYFGEQFPIYRCTYAVDNQLFQRECAAASLHREAFRAMLGLERGRPVILFAAKLIPRKRCADLLEAFLKLSSEEADRPRPYLLIVGDGEERTELEQRAKAAPPGDVHFLGFRNQSELPGLYDLCDVFVLASVDEPWGLSINEVMNAGRAVIVSDQVGCHRDLVQDGVNGCVVKARDVNSLAKGLRTILANEQTWKFMGESSLRIIQNAGFDQNVAALRQLLKDLFPGFSASESAAR